MDSEKQLHQCPECKLHYSDKELASKCEKWCRENKSCNLEITKFSAEALEFANKVNDKNTSQKETK